MDLTAFWRIIDNAREQVDELEEVGPAVISALEKLEPDEIVSFKQHQYDLEDASYSWDLWAVAYILNGGCSDDCFDYFRSWLMANGSKRWEEAMRHPASVGEYAEFEEIEYEDFMYVAVDAYKSRTGEDFPYSKVEHSRPELPLGTEWDEDSLPEIYPELWKKYS